MQDAVVEKIEAFLKHIGCSTYRIEPRGKHRQLVVNHEGRRGVVTIPSTGSDWRGPRNAIRDLRHELGLINTRTRNEGDGSRQKSNKVPRRRMKPAGASMFTPRANQTERYYAPLREIRERLVLHAGTAVAAMSPSTEERDIVQNKVGFKPIRKAAEAIVLRTPFLGHKRRVWGVG